MLNSAVNLQIPIGSNVKPTAQAQTDLSLYEIKLLHVGKHNPWSLSDLPAGQTHYPFRLKT